MTISRSVVPCYCWGSCYPRVHCSLVSLHRPGFGCLYSPGLGLSLEAHTSSRSHRPGDSVGSCETWDRAPVPYISDKFLFSFSDPVAIVKGTLQSWREWRKEAAVLCFWRGMLSSSSRPLCRGSFCHCHLGRNDSLPSLPFSLYTSGEPVILTQVFVFNPKDWQQFLGQPGDSCAIWEEVVLSPCLILRRQLA